MLRTATLVAALAAAALLPGTAGAATLVNDATNTLHYTAADGEANRLNMWVVDVGYGMVKDDGITGLTGTGCEPSNIMAGWLQCPNARRPHVSLGDEDDHALIQDGGSDEMEWIGVANVDAGPGDDHVSTGSAPDVLIGGPGNDTLKPFFGANRVEGGDGDDILESVFGDDTKIGGAGADTFKGHDGNETVDAVDGAATDTVTCGDGTDTVTADHGDSVSGDCETVTRVGTKPGGGETPAPEQPGPGRPGSDQPGDTTGPVVPSDDHTVPPAADRTAPKLTVRVKRRRGRRVVTVRADEAVTLGWGRKTRALAVGKRARIVVRGRRRAFRLVARDAAGNETVKRVR